MSLSDTVMILGGDVSATPAIASLKEHGYRVVVVDGSPTAPGFGVADVCGKFNFREVERVIELARNEKVRAVIATHDRAVMPSARVNESLGLRGPSPASASIATNKKEMRRVWRSAGLPSPDIALADSPERFREAVDKIGFPAICKPTDDVGGGGRGIRKIDAQTDLCETYRYACSFSDSPEVLVEPFYEGLEHSTEVLMRGGKGSVLMISDKVKTAPPYRVDKAVIYPTSLDGAAHQAIEELAVASAKAVGLTDGAAHIEMATLADGSNVLFEIALRCGGGVTPHPVAECVTGRNQFVEYAEILFGRTDRDITPTHKRGACFYFITSRPGLLKAIEGYEAASALPGVIAHALTVKPGDTVRELKTSSHRLGFFVTTGETAQEAYDKGIEAENLLNFLYEE